MDISTSSAYAGVDPGQTPQMLAYVAKGSPIGITADSPDIFLVRRSARRRRILCDRRQLSVHGSGV
jgi:hypothetical protein